jgi:alpha-mannosidase
VAVGPVLARLRITGETGGLRVTNFVTLYAQLDQVDFDVWIHKPVTTVEQRLVHVFPVVREDAVVRIETPAAVVRPYPQPRGDLLPGADPRRFAVQGFVDASTAAAGVTVAPLEAFALRMDLEPFSFEALGNDQDYKEVSPDQGGVAEFRFRYVVCGHAGGYQQADAVAWSRAVATPWLVLSGRELRQPAPAPPVVDPRRAVATCFKPADGAGDGSVILRLWEIAGQTGPTRIQVPGCRRAWRTDLLERDLGELPVRRGVVELDLNAYGLASARLLQ